MHEGVVLGLLGDFGQGVGLERNFNAGIHLGDLVNVTVEL